MDIMPLNLHSTGASRTARPAVKTNQASVLFSGTSGKKPVEKTFQELIDSIIEFCESQWDIWKETRRSERALRQFEKSHGIDPKSVRGLTIDEKLARYQAMTNSEQQKKDPRK